MDILSEIKTKRLARITERSAQIPLERLRETAKARTDFRPFFAALNEPGIRVIAEIKEASPSRGALVESLDAEKVAREYEAGGAAAISVLTEPDYFRGSLERLAAVRSSAVLPILQKDFIVSDYQVYEAAALGADAILLIARLVSARELTRLHDLAAALGLTPVIEIYDADELSILDRLPKNRLVGINNRDLATFKTDSRRALRLIDGVIARNNRPIVFSALHGRSDLEPFLSRTKRFLIGEHFITAKNRTEAVRELVR